MDRSQAKRRRGKHDKQGDTATGRQDRPQAVGAHYAPPTFDFGPCFLLRFYIENSKDNATVNDVRVFVLKYV